MSNAKSEPEGHPTPSRQTGANPFGFTGAISPQLLPLFLAIIAIALTWVFVQVTRFPDAWVPFVFGALSLATILKLKFSVYLAIGLIIMIELGGNFESTKLTLEGLLFVALGLAYIIFSFRFMDMRVSFGYLLDAKPKVAMSTKNRAHWQTLRPFRAGWHWAFVAVLLGGLLLLFIDHDPNSRVRYGITSDGLRAITLLWLLAVVWFLIETASRLTKRGKGGALQGRVFARSVFCREIKREMYSIERKRIKRRGGKST